MNANKQTLVEFAEHIAITKNNTRYYHHNYTYLLFQRQIFNYIEDSKSFKDLPVAFASRAQLDIWAKQNHQQMSVVGIGIPHTDAAITLGMSYGPQLLIGQQFLWVKATSGLYRKALLAWMDTLRKGNYQSLHMQAAEYCRNLVDALRKKEIRRKISDSRRAALAREFEDLSDKFTQASQSPQAAQANIALLDLMDRSLDADHVINRKSLTLLPDAWVMIAPVLSGTNRKFGRIIESRATPFSSSTTSIPLDPITALKLHAATIPTCQAELKAAYGNFRSWLLKSPELSHEFNAAEPILIGLINGSVKSFAR